MTETIEEYNVNRFTVTLYSTVRPVAVPFELTYRKMCRLYDISQKISPGTKAQLVVEFNGLLYSFEDLLAYPQAPYLLEEICEPLLIVPYKNEEK